MTKKDIDDIIEAVCPNDEDLEEPIISPAFLRKELEWLALEQEPDRQVTNEEALIYLDDIETDVVYNITRNEKEAIKVAREAIKKQIPKKPLKKVIEYPYSQDLETAQCPSCKRRLRTGKAGAKDSYCPNCGQKIDWSVKE